MIGQHTHQAIADARAFIDAADRALHSLSPELRNEVKAAFERNGSMLLTATALRQLNDRMPVPADFNWNAVEEATMDD